MTRDCWTPLGPACVLIPPDTPADGGKPAARANEAVLRSGRFTCLAFDPRDTSFQTVYAGSATGGVWKTTNAGQTWRPLDDRAPSLAVSALAIDVTDTNAILYVGTRNDPSAVALTGGGLFVTSNDGVDWMPRPDTDLLLTREVNAILVDTRRTKPDDGSHPEVWVATTSGLFQTKNGGLTWQEILHAGFNGVLEPGGDWRSLVLSDGHIVGTLAGDGVYLEDGTFMNRVGTSSSPGILPHSDPDFGIVVVAAAPSHDQQLYLVGSTLRGTVKWLFRSNDGGRNWLLGHPPSDDWGGESLVVVVHPENPDRLYLIGDSNHRTDDGGTSEEGWTEFASRQKVHALAIAPGHPFPTWIATDEGVWLSTSEAGRAAGGSEAWQIRDRGLATLQIESLAQHSTERSILLAGGTEGLLRRRGHAMWTQQSPKRCRRVVHDPSTPATFYALISGVSRSTDGGSTWVKLPDEPSVPFFIPSALAVDPSQKGIVYAGIDRLFRWDESKPEIGWVALPGFKSLASIMAIAVAPSDSNIIYAAAGKFIRRIDGSGGAFAASGDLGPPGGGFFPTITNIAVDPEDPDLLYVANGFTWGVGNTATSADRLWISGDGGGSWRQVSLALIPTAETLITNETELNSHASIHKILIDPEEPRRLFLATDRGVLVSTDDGLGAPRRRWRRIDGNLPRVPVTDIAIFPPRRPHLDPDETPPIRVIRAATWGRGVWERVLDPALIGDTDYPTPPFRDTCVGQGVEVYVRDNILDTGEAATPETAIDPVGGVERSDSDGPDLRLDRRNGDESWQLPVSNFAYLPAEDAAAIADYAGFEALAERGPQKDATHRVYVQVHNRGPRTAKIRVRALWHTLGPGNLFSLPADPFGTIAATDDWQPVGDTIEVNVMPTEPRVVRWADWHVPNTVPDEVSLVAVVSADDDPLVQPADPDSRVEYFAPRDRHLLRRTYSVLPRASKKRRGWFRWWMPVLAVGVILAIWGLVELAQDDDPPMMR
jgi:photosystem II stability/assembly factor-like uncharacterized protein